MRRLVSPFGMAKLDLPRTISFHLDSIRDDIYLRRVFLSNELGKHRPDEGLHPTGRGESGERRSTAEHWSAVVRCAM